MTTIWKASSLALVMGLLSFHNEPIKEDHSLHRNLRRVKVNSPHDHPQSFESRAPKDDNQRKEKLKKGLFKRGFR